LLDYPPASAMDCFQDFCLACDGESREGPYCSQRCRLADLEKASPPSSPTTFSSPSKSTTSSGYILAPAYQFPQRTNSSRPSSGQYGQPQSSTKESTQSPHRYERSLTPSSSRSSLSSNISTSGGTIISEQARQELQEYFDSFAVSKASKRRTSSY